MKNLLAGLVAVAVLLPAAEVRKTETDRGASELVGTVAASVEKSAAENHSHTWVKTGRYNFTQKYAMQRELEKKGYNLDVPFFGSTFVGW